MKPRTEAKHMSRVFFAGGFDCSCAYVISLILCGGRVGKLSSSMKYSTQVLSVLP